ncbi:MAG: ATP-dependent DNA helicase [Opitutaceae bacterium]
MQIDPILRSVRMSVGELATFRNLPKNESFGYSPWRAAVGQKWHKTTEEQVSEQVPDARFEVSIKAELRHRNWTFKLQGRIDQVLPQGDGLCLREVKTVRHGLPEAPDELLNKHPDYFAQAATYQALAELLPEFNGQAISAELFFIDIENGAVQSVPLNSEMQSLFTQQLDAWIPFLEDRRSCRIRLNDAHITPAFSELRDGQAELFAALEKATLQAKTVLLEAPTGFGKTGIILEHALKQLKAGVFERCVYLTSKATGQIETIRQLKTMIGDQIRFIQMRNRDEHKIASHKHTCSGDRHCEDDLGQRWLEAAIDPPELFEEATLELDRARDLGADTGICPYSLTKACLPYAEVWIGDSNYVFGPTSQYVFLDQQGFEPKKTLLIIDEAHNLPDRVADTLSVELKTGDLVFALEEIRSAGASRRLLGIGNELIRFIDSLAAQQEINANEAYELLDLCEDFSDQLQNAPIDYEQCPPFALEVIWKIPDIAHRLSQDSHEWFHWSSNKGCFRSTCLDAQQWIHKCIQPFGASVLMSATISPVDTFQARCGLDSEHTTVAVGYAPWRENAYDVAIDCRVDTRYSKRKSYYEQTALTVAALINSSPGVPVAVFFASYQYAENILTYLEVVAPGVRASVQPRGVNLTEQEAFIDEGLLTADALFLILGSSYAEGVDKLGGRIETVMVVGPALPEVNLVQTAKMDAHDSPSRDEKFRAVYILPAMQRIHQALGRIVRAPEHRARVLLHGKRYAELAYKSALADEYQQAIEIHSDQKLFEWVHRS